MLSNKVDSYFSFLVDEFNYDKPISYDYVHEVHTDYINKQSGVAVKIIWDGGYWCELIRINEEAKRQLSSGKKLAMLDDNEAKQLDIKALDRDKKIYNSVSSDNFPEKELWYFSTLLKKHPEIHDGNFDLFSWKKRFLNKFRLR